MSVDEARGIVFIPLGSPAFDFYGGNRKGENLFGNCLLALDASTGAVNGIISWSTTISGIMIYRRRRHW